MGCGFWYVGGMGIGWIMFWKAVVLTIWAEVDSYRAKRKLLTVTKYGGDASSAKQPLALPYLVSDLHGDGGVEL